MDNNLLTKVHSYGTASNANSSFSIGVTDILFRTMYDTNSSPNMESIRADIYKSYNDSTVFDRIVNKEKNPFLSRKDIGTTVVNLVNYANLKESTNSREKTFAECNTALPIAFAKAVSDIIGPHQQNGNKYIVEWNIANTRPDAKDSLNILLNGLDGAAPVVTSSLNLMGKWSADNVNQVVDLQRVISQNRRDLAPILSDLIVQQNIGVTALRILDNVSRAARVAKDASSDNTKKKVVTYGECMSMANAILNNDTWIAKQNCGRDILAIMTPDEISFILNFNKMKASGKLNNNTFVNIVKGVKDDNLAKCILLSLYANKTYKINEAVEMAVLAYAIGRVGKNNVTNNIMSNIDNKLVAYIIANIGGKIDVSDMIYADITRIPVPILTRLYGAIVNSQEIDYIGLNVIPKIKSNLNNHLNAFKNASRGPGGYNKNSSLDMVQYLTSPTVNVGLSGNNRDVYNASPNVEKLAVAMLRLLK